MTPKQAISFIEKHGVVLAAANGPVPRLAEVIANGPIKGSWWGHPKGKEIFSIFQVVHDSADILVCRLVGNKVTFVHRRLWPALVRAASRFPKRQLAQVREEHTAAGHHVSREVAFPKWVPAAVMKASRLLDEEAAVQKLGAWATKPIKLSSERRSSSPKQRMR
jgi:hypothetical protein